MTFFRTKASSMTCFFAIAAGMALLSSPVVAQVNQTTSKVPMPDQGAYMVQVLLGLLFVVGLVFALAWLLKRVGQGSLVGSRQMKIVASLPLGTRERLALVEVGGQHILLGITPTSINTLHVFDEPIDLEVSGEDGSDFATKLKDILNKGTVKS